MKNRNILIIFLSLLLLSTGCGGGSSDNSSIEAPPDEPTFTLSPAYWEDGAIAEFSDKEKIWRTNAPLPALQSQNAMITGTKSPLAIRSGLEALKRGGNAADAVITTALAQIALDAGVTVSYTGILHLMYYDAGEDKIYSLNAGWDVPIGEDDPFSIPSDIKSGRNTLVPGFFAGIEAAHNRFGDLPFDALFELAIYFAEQGFEVNNSLGGWIAYWQDLLSERSETWEIFTDDSGRFYKTGDWFTQPALAQTLKNVSTQGKDYIYNGAWVDKFVAEVQNDGGKITQEDMDAYEVIWSDPLSTTFRDYEIYAPGLPESGGVNIIEGLNLLEAAGFPERGSYTDDPESLYWFMHINRTSHFLSSLDEATLEAIAPGLDLSFRSRATKETAAELWERTQTVWAPQQQTGTHSDGVVARDEEGNIAAILHTINGGDTGIYIDGISISNIGSWSQHLMNIAGPGNRIPIGLNPTIIYKNGSPVLASSSIGAIHPRTLAVLYNYVAYDMDIESASLEPYLLFTDYSNWDWSEDSYTVERVIQGQFDESLIDAVIDLGQQVSIVPEESALENSASGLWVGIEINPDNSQLTGVTASYINGVVLGY